MSKRVPIPIYSFVLVLIEHQGRYLLIQEAKEGHPWYFPAGGIEPGEDLIKAAKRETLEEAGVHIKPEYLLEIEHSIPLEQTPNTPAPERWRFFTMAKYLSGTPKSYPDQESLQACWFYPAELSKLSLRTPKVLELVEKHQKNYLNLTPIEIYKNRTYGQDHFKGAR